MPTHASRPRVLLAAATSLLVATAAPRAHAQILEISGATLTSYKPAAATRVQGVRPRFDQRGVHVDGSVRAGSPFGWDLAGGSGGGSGGGGAKLGDINLVSGAVELSEVDIALPSRGIPWVVGRTYNQRQMDSGGAELTSDGYQGKNWFQSSQPEIRLFDSDGNPATKEAADAVYLVYGADRYVEFVRTAANADTFKGRNGAAGVVKFESGSPDTYTYTDQRGNRAVFFGATPRAGGPTSSSGR
jgi:hypothetical protein